MSCRYQPIKGTMTFSNGLTMTREQLEKGGFGQLTETIFHFCSCMSQLEVDSAEYALLSAICLISGGRHTQ